MSRLDLASYLSPMQSLAPAARTASANGTGVDLSNYHAAVAVIDVGTWTDGTHTFALQESEDNSTYTAVADTDLVGTEPVIDAADEDLVTHEVGYLGTQRYLRVAVTVAGTTTGAVYGASIIRGKARTLPA